jgi:hypothetical protein
VRIPYKSVLAGVLALPLLTGCLLLNDVSRVDDRAHRPGPDRALVILGVGIEGPWEYPQFSARLFEYDMARKAMVGNCWRWNRLEAATGKPIEYFFFDVAPGYYAGDTLFRGEAGPLAFEVPAGRVVYLGDFIYAKDRKVDLRRNTKAATEALKSEAASGDSEVVVARTAPAASLQMFLCSP